jgi:hypothetical protein
MPAPTPEELERAAYIEAARQWEAAREREKQEQWEREGLEGGS